VSDDQNAQEVSDPVVEMATCPKCGHSGDVAGGSGVEPSGLP
jgi:hypothetical protein